VDLLRFIPIYVSISTRYSTRSRSVGRDRTIYIYIYIFWEVGGGKLFVEDDEASADGFYCGDLLGDPRQTGSRYVAVDFIT
jgi:hypothetical protein